MKKSNLYRLFLKDLFRNQFFLFFFITNLSISLTGLIGLENFKSAFQSSIRSRAKEIAGSDLSISGRRALNDKKLQEINNYLKPLAIKRLVSFFSMAKSDNVSKLVRVSEFSSDFPFYGKVEFSPAVHELKSGEVIIYPSVLKIFDVEVGDYLNIGGVQYKISSVVKNDSSETFDMGQIAPKVILSADSIHSGEYLTKGSTAFHGVYFKTRFDIDNDTKNKVIDLINDSSIRVRTGEDTSGQVGRVLQYLNDFLGIVSIVALFLSLVGGFYLYLSFLLKKRKTISIYKSLGLSLTLIRKGLHFQCFAVAVMSLIVSVVLSLLLNRIGRELIAPYLANPLNVSLSVQGIGIAIAVVLIIFLFLMKPLITSTLSEKANALFQENRPSHQSGKRSVARIFSLMIPVLFLLAFFMSSSWKISLAFILSLIIGVGIVQLFFYLFHRFVPTPKKLELKLALLYVKRQRLSTLSIFISIFFGVSLMNLIPVVERSINSQMNGVGSSTTPEFFLFDIQEEQIDDLKNLAKKTSSEIMSLSPMIRARLIKINDEPVRVKKKKALTREEQRAQQFQNRGVNLSYRAKLNSGEEVIEGSFIPHGSEKYIPLSLEKRYMDRIGVELGDRLTFDILGLDFEGVITSVRQVRWTSFLPNFFILFPTGILEDTPKTFLAGIKIKGDDKVFIDQMYASLPNVSIVDIRDISSKVMSVMSEMSLALLLMSTLSILVGFIIVISLVNHQLIERKKDIYLFHMIGLGRKRIKQSIIAEFLGVTLIAAIFGAFFGQTLGQIISYKVFFSFGKFEYLIAFKIIFVLLVSLLGIIKYSLRKI